MKGDDFNTKRLQHNNSNPINALMERSKQVGNLHIQTEQTN